MTISITIDYRFIDRLRLASLQPDNLTISQPRSLTASQPRGLATSCHNFTASQPLKLTASLLKAKYRLLLIP